MKWDEIKDNPTCPFYLGLEPWYTEGRCYAPPIGNCKRNKTKWPKFKKCKKIKKLKKHKMFE